MLKEAIKKVDVIQYHRKKYWDEDSPEISDYQYSILLKDTIDFVNGLDDTDKKDELLNILNQVESPSDVQSKVSKNYGMMLSIENFHDFSKVIAWATKYARSKHELFRLSIKYDGVSGKKYEQKLLSRGNRRNINELADISKVNRITKFITKKADGENFNCELIIPLDKFDNYNETILTVLKGKKKYKNTRSMVSSLVKMTEDKLDKLIGKISIYAVDHEFEYKTIDYQTLSEDNLHKIFEELKKDNLTTPYDGMVIELDDRDYLNALGHNNKSYYGRICYKEDDVEMESVIIDVKLSSGKGVITPVIHIKPIDVGGITISKITGHNAKIVIDKDMKIGDKVVVVRKDAATPMIKSVSRGETRVDIDGILKVCPCEKNSPVEYREPFLYCLNENCEQSLKRQLKQCCDYLNIREIGPSTIDKIIGKYKIKNFYDLLQISYNQFLQLEGFGATKAKKVADEIKEKTVNIEDFKILACCNIPGIALSLSEKIFDRYTFNELFELSVDDLSDITDIGETRASLIFEGIREHFDMIKSFYKNKKYNINETKGSSMRKPEIKGTICFSGNFPKKKSYYEQLAKNKGYEIKQSITTDLTCLVFNGARSTKYDKAVKNGVKILSIEGFMDMVK